MHWRIVKPKQFCSAWQQRWQCGVLFVPPSDFVPDGPSPATFIVSTAAGALPSFKSTTVLCITRRGICTMGHGKVSTHSAQSPDSARTISLYNGRTMESVAPAASMTQGAVAYMLTRRSNAARWHAGFPPPLCTWTLLRRALREARALRRRRCTA